MSGEPAVRKVLLGLNSWLDGHLGSGVGLEIDRPFNLAFHDDDFPLVNIRCPVTSYSNELTYNAWLHEGLISFDVITRSSTLSNIDADQAEIAAKMVERLGARVPTPGTIGELLTKCDPVSMGPDTDENRLVDHGESVFVWRMLWLTPINDFRTIIGANGPVA